MTSRKIKVEKTRGPVLPRDESFKPPGEDYTDAEKYDLLSKEYDLNRKQYDRVNKERLGYRTKLLSGLPADLKAEIIAELNSPDDCEYTDDDYLRWLLRRADRGNTDYARLAYSKLAEMLLCKEKEITPLALHVIAVVLITLSKPSSDVLKDLKLKNGSSQTREKHIDEDMQIIIEMMSLLETRPRDGESEEAPATKKAKMRVIKAAEIIVASGRFPGKTAKTIGNMYSSYMRDPLGYLPE